MKLILKWASIYRFTTLAGASRVATLNHELFDDAMKNCPIIVLNKL